MIFFCTLTWLLLEFCVRLFDPNFGNSSAVGIMKKRNKLMLIGFFNIENCSIHLYFSYAQSSLPKRNSMFVYLVPQVIATWTWISFISPNFQARWNVQILSIKSPVSYVIMVYRSEPPRSHQENHTPKPRSWLDGCYESAMNIKLPATQRERQPFRYTRRALLWWRR